MEYDDLRQAEHEVVVGIVTSELFVVMDERDSSSRRRKIMHILLKDVRRDPWKSSMSYHWDLAMFLLYVVSSSCSYRRYRSSPPI